MPDILIRGMDIPKDGRKHTALLQFLEDGTCRCVVEYSQSYDARSVKVFEVVQLPAGHGRAIDADAMLKKYVYEAQGLDGIYDTTDLPEMLSYMPSIVPAEGGTEECSEN